MIRLVPRRPHLARATLACALLVAALAGPARGESPCVAAGTEAEQRHGVPAGLLNAIGRIESGRRDPSTGQLAAWPWAINAEGRGRLFDSRDDALAGTRALQASGAASIDVGCFQINLLHHPGAFESLEHGFDPARNADYAARFLLALRNRAGSWEQAVADYHSANPERGLPYRDRVLATWSRDGGGPAPSGASAAPSTVAVGDGAGGTKAAALPAMLRTIAWTPSAAGGLRVWTPSAPGQGASVVSLSPGPGRRAAPRG